MTFSYTQVSQYLRCPRSYRYRYLDGWREKESRAALCFGRCFEKALAAFFEREDPGAVLFKEWGAYRDVPLEYSHGDDWERLLRQGIGLLEQFARDNRIRIRQPKRNMQKKLVRPLANGNEFVAYVDAIGQLDGKQRLLEWKTTSARYPEQPEGLTSLDLQLVCYSWISGISDVAIVAFVRKRVPEIQYLTGFDYRGAAPGVWPGGGSDGPSNRNRPVPSPPRNPFPAERVRQLRPSWPVPWERATDRIQTHSSTRSERP